MDKNNKKEILEQIENILKDYDKLKATFESLGYIGMLGKAQKEIAKINGLITRTKALISSIFSKDSIYQKQIELHSKGRNGVCGRSELNMVMADLKVVYDAIIQKINKNMDSQQIKKCVKRLFVFLKKYKFYNFLSTGDFIDALMEIDLDNIWEKNIYDLKELIAIHDEIQYIDVYEKTFIDLFSKRLLENKGNFIQEIDHIVNALISHYSIQDFDYNEFKIRILKCGFNHDDINQMQCLRIIDLSEMLEQIPIQNVLPEDIDYQKYEEIFEKLKLPNTMFQYIFVCENILRKFIIQVLDDNGYPSIESIGSGKLTKVIQDRKKQEANQNYLPIRGDHDIYYLDLIEVNRIFIHLWNNCFKNKFERQSWICERIESLYAIRNRVAHSSGYLTRAELRSVETRCREIIKQIDQYIK